MKNQLQLPFWLITLTTIVSLVGYILIQDGMFMDAMLYTSVAKNLGNGIGTFWFPKFSEYGLAGLYTFHEHPPLTFGIQSLFYKVLGNSMYTERIYTFLACLFTAFLIHKTWKLVTKNQLSSNISWLPIFFWIIIPVCFWSYQNNMQENTMGIFTLLAVYFSVKGMITKEKIIFNTILSGIFIFCASLCKGVPGLFPLGVIGFYWLVFRDFSFGKAFLYTLLLIAVPVAIYSLLMLHPVANDSLTTYVQLRLMKRVEAAHTVDSHFWVVGRLFSELLPVIIPVVIFLIVFKIKKISQTHFSNHNKLAILFCLIGASGSLALMLTKVQKGFYFVHSLPFWAIGLSLFIAPGVALLIQKINVKSNGFKIFKVLSAVLLIVSLVIVSMQKGKTSRNADILHDVYLFGEIIPSHSIINMSIEMQDSWDLQCYLIRYFNISIDQSDNQREYYIIEKNLNFSRPNTYEKLPLETERYYLYKQKNQNQLQVDSLKINNNQNLVSFKPLIKIDSLIKLNSINENTINDFIDSLKTDLTNNVEYNEWSGEIILTLLEFHTNDFTSALNKVNKPEKINFIINKIENPINDSYSLDTNMIKDESKINDLIIKAIKIANKKI